MQNSFVSPCFKFLNPRTASLSIVCCFCFVLPAYSQSVAIPEDSKFVLNLDMQALQTSKIGSRLMGAMQQSFQDEMKKSTKKFFKQKKESKDSSGGENGGLSLEKVSELLGMNPLTEIQQLVISSSDFENPEKSMLAQVRLRKNPGNIEGLLLNLPGYDSSEVNGLTIHSAKPDDNKEVFGCLKQGRDGNYTFYASSNRDNLLEAIKGATTSSGTFRPMQIEDERKTFLGLQVSELKNLDLGEGPQANIARMLQGLVLSISEDSENLELRGTLQAATPKKAQQLRQAIQGLVSMFELFASMDDSDDKDLQQVLEQVRKLSISQDDTKVRLRWSVPSEQVLQMIEEEMNNR